ncbi:MAG: hypothetical protein ACI870_000041 [Crocinitomicaceae bacterium]|jgi:hypothetical protein
MKKKCDFGSKAFNIAAYLLINKIKNITFDGAAGTGKTTFARRLKEFCEIKGINVALTAVTGTAANNIGGVTISSFCQLRTYNLEDHEIIERNQLVTALLRLVKILVIDEVSMLTDEQLRQINIACQAAKGNKKPFGGISVLLMGDLCQLEPIEINDDEIIAIDSVLETKEYLKKLNFTQIRLKKNYRQTDERSLYFLNSLRNMIVNKSINKTKINELFNFLKKNTSHGIHLYSNIKDVPLEEFNPSHYYYSKGNAPYTALPIMYGYNYLITKNTDNYFNGQHIVLSEDNEEEFLYQDFLYKKESGFDNNGTACLHTVFDRVIAEYLALIPLSDMTTRRVQGSTFDSGCIASEFFAEDNKVLQVSLIGWLKTLYTALGRFRDLSNVSLC